MAGRGNPKLDWKAIQAYYDAGHSFSECGKYFGFYVSAFSHAKKKGWFIPRSNKEAAKIQGKKRQGTTLSEEHKRKISKTVNKRVQQGTWHYSFSKVRSHKYKSKYAGEVNLMGSWEYLFAQYLDKNNIPWRRPKEKFYYEFDGLKSGKGYYVPDFYLIEEDLYIEIKGYETDKDRAKWKWFPLQLKILKEQDLKKDYNLKI